MQIFGKIHSFTCRKIFSHHVIAVVSNNAIVEAMFQKEHSIMHKSPSLSFNNWTLFCVIIAWIICCVGIDKNEKCQHSECQQKHCGKFWSKKPFHIPMESVIELFLSVFYSVHRSNTMTGNIESFPCQYHRKIKSARQQHWIRFTNIPKKSILLPNMISVSGELISKKVAKKIISTDVMPRMRGNFLSRRAME